MKKSCKNDVSKNRNIEVKVMEVRVINLDSSIAFTKGFSTYLRKVSYKIPTSHIPWRLGILACDRLENDRKGCNSLGSTFKDLSLFMKKKPLQYLISGAVCQGTCILIIFGGWVGSSEHRKSV